VLVRKLGAPGNPEFAIGALAEGGVRVLSEPLVWALGLSGAELGELLADVEGELAERLRRYRGAEEPVDLTGRTAILVDDGLATGRSAQAAVRSLRRRGASSVILAVPVAAPESARALSAEADEVVCVEAPADFWAVGYWYEDFRATSDEEVAQLLAANRQGRGGGTAARHADRAPAGAESSGLDLEGATRGVVIPIAGELALRGELSVPPSARGIVVFAHGSGSSRFSPRNRAVARTLETAGFATLLFDLLTPIEEAERSNVFDIQLLASRLTAVSGWLAGCEQVAGLPLAYFGASTGGAAALSAAAALGERVSAVVSRGGRPDLALGLDLVRAPVLLIVGAADREVLELNREARRQLHCPNELAIVPGAAHLFEEPGALERVANLAVEWFERHLPRPRQPRTS
jgi:putative phosphoribosyl transferase